MDRARFEHLLAQRSSRRAVLGAALTGGATAVSLRGHATKVGASQARPGAVPESAPRWASTPFALGVASGDPLPDGVVLWTRLDPDPGAEVGGMAGRDPIAVRWEIAADDGFRRVAGSGTAVAVPDLAHSVHVDATGLEPGREYFYRFMVGGEISPVGRTKTAPAAGAATDRLRFAVASCAHWEHGWFTAYRHLAAEDLDLVLHLGDYLYEYPAGREFLPTGGTPVRLHTGGEAVTLADYRARHALYKTDPDLQAAHAAAPWVATWDDHEVENNYAGATSERGDPPAAFLARRAAAYQAYYEHMPLRPDSLPQGPDLRLYRRLTFGALAEMSLLDTRQYRTDQPCGDNLQVRCAAALDPDATLTGPDQERWLLRGLDRSPATWNVIAQQTMMAEHDTQAGTATEYPMDQWDGYPAARNRILGHLLHAGIANPVVLSGDIHSAWVNDLRADFADPASAVVATELIAASVTADNPFVDRLRFAPLLNPHVRFVDGTHGYTRCELTQTHWRADFRGVPTVFEPDAPVRTVASWVIEAGRPGAERA